MPGGNASSSLLIAAIAPARSSGWWSAPIEPPIPLVCSSTWHTVALATGPTIAGTSLPTGSSRHSFPPSASLRIAVAVNALVTDPM